MLKRLLSFVGIFRTAAQILSAVGLLSLGVTLWSKSPSGTQFFNDHPRALQLGGEGLIGLAVTVAVLWCATIAIERIARIVADNDELTREVRNVREQLSWKDLTQAGVAVRRCRALWEQATDPSVERNTYEDDPVYQQVRLDKQLATIFAQPIVQRLNHVKQLSFAYLTFHSATHTRLAHSLGACRNAELVMRRIFQEGRLYSRAGEEKIELTEDEKTKYIKLAMVTALVHDLGHAPLSHALEIHLRLGKEGKARVRPDKRLSQQYIFDYLRPTIEAAGVSPDDVIALIKKDIDRFRSQPWMHFISDLIDSPLDVDRMDYLARDSHMTGLTIGALNMQAFIERIVPFREIEKDQVEKIKVEKIELAFHETAVPYVEQFLYARDVMYLNCYEHPKKVVAESMLGIAFDDFLARSGGSEPLNPRDLALLTDQQMIELMFTYSGPSTVTFRFLERLMRGVTFEQLTEIPIDVDLSDGGEFQTERVFEKLPAEIQGWALKAIREDYEGAYLRTPAEWAKNLGTEAEVDDSKIIVTVPSWSLVDKWLKEGEIRILSREPGSAGYTVEHVHKVSKIIKDFTKVLARARLKLRVFVDPDLTVAERSRVSEAAKNQFSKI